MPMNTILVILARASPLRPSPWPGLTCANSRCASHTCPTISATLKLRLNPCCAVEQNVQSMAQPTWLEMHRVPRSGSGMYTVSIPCTSSMRSIHLRVPSLDTCSVTICGTAPINPLHQLTGAKRLRIEALGHECLEFRARQPEQIYAFARHRCHSSIH